MLGATCVTIHTSFTDILCCVFVSLRCALSRTASCVEVFRGALSKARGDRAFTHQHPMHHHHIIVPSSTRRNGRLWQSHQHVLMSAQPAQFVALPEQRSDGNRIDPSGHQGVKATCRQGRKAGRRAVLAENRHGARALYGAAPCVQRNGGALLVIAYELAGATLRGLLSREVEMFLRA